LNNKEQLAPFKGKVKKPERAIYNYRWYGPTFGENDIRIDKWGSTGHSHSITNFGNDYFVPENVNDTKTILAGVDNFHPDEVEVFLFKLIYESLQPITSMLPQYTDKQPPPF